MTCGNYRKKTEYRCPICGKDLAYNKFTRRFECKQGHVSLSKGIPLSLSKAFVIDVTPLFDLNKKRTKEIDCNTLEIARD